MCYYIITGRDKNHPEKEEEHTMKKIMITTADYNEKRLAGYASVEEAIADILKQTNWPDFYAATMWGYPAVYAVEA